MNTELVQSIRVYADRGAPVTIVDQAEADRLRAAVAAQFGFPDDKLWWWEHLPAERVSSRHSESDPEDWQARILDMLPADDRPLWLFVTDDNPPPWLCVSGTRTALVDLILAQHYFEYFIVDQAHTWILFDTHHNVLIAAGTGRTPVVR